MKPDAVRQLARLVIGSEHPRGEELRSWLEDGVMSTSQERRIGRRDKPPCFSTEEQWIAWCVHEAGRPITNGSGYCYDCTARHKAAMVDNNKCEHPLTIFKRVGQSPGVVGQRPLATRLLHRTPRRRKNREPA